METGLNKTETGLNTLNVYVHLMLIVLTLPIIQANVLNPHQFQMDAEVQCLALEPPQMILAPMQAEILELVKQKFASHYLLLVHLIVLTLFFMLMHVMKVL